MSWQQQQETKGGDVQEIWSPSRRFSGVSGLSIWFCLLFINVL